MNNTSCAFRSLSSLDSPYCQLDSFFMLHSVMTTVTNFLSKHDINLVTTIVVEQSSFISLTVFSAGWRRFGAAILPARPQHLRHCLRIVRENNLVFQICTVYLVNKQTQTK